MSDEPIADVAPVPISLRGRVLTPTAKLLENGLFLGQFLLFAALAFTPAILGGLAATRQLFPGNQALSFAPVVIGLALTAGLSWVLGSRMLRKPWSADYLFRKARAELLRRPDALVDPNTSEAIFVEVVPRRNWGQIALQNAEDLGFLLLDSERRQLLIEGDNKRYRVPTAAVVSCDVELMNASAAGDSEAIPVGLVVLTVRDRLGPRAVPLRPVRGLGRVMRWAATIWRAPTSCSGASRTFVPQRCQNRPMRKCERARRARRVSEDQTLAYASGSASRGCKPSLTRRAP